MRTLVIVFLCFMACLGIFNFATRKYLNPYKLFLVFGKKGSGKSTYLVKLAQQHIKKGWHVYTNMDELFMDGVRHFNIQHLGDFVPEAQSLLLLDEVGMIWDNRDYKLFKSTVRDFFKLQRHYHVKVYMASQTFDVDKKIRDLCDGMFLHQNVARVFTVGKRIVRKVVITQSTSEAESRISEDLVMLPFWDWTFTYIPKWSRYFDSHCIPNMPLLKYKTDGYTDQGEILECNDPLTQGSEVLGCSATGHTDPQDMACGWTDETPSEVPVSRARFRLIRRN